MTARILSGREAADRLLESLRPKIALLKPKLVIIQVGSDPASEAYVRQKLKACAAIGMESEHKKLDENISEEELFAVIDECNNDPSVTGFIVQMPLPSSLQKIGTKVQGAVDPKKDVDGFHPKSLFTPATPAGVMLLLDDSGIELKGKHAVVIGRSATVGKPLTELLRHRGMTVDVVSRETKDVPAVTLKADVLCSAAGSPKMVKADMVKPGAVVIDIGLTRVGKELIGDVDFDPVKEIASAITPVPGGVGPMTVASLIANCVKAAEMKS